MLAAFVKDADIFVSTFHYPISQSAPHIYISALPFTPLNSIVSKQFLPKYPHLLSVIAGKLSEWPTVPMTFDGHTDEVYSVACSPDGKHIVSGSKDQTVQLWDIETGEVITRPFKGHTHTVLYGLLPTHLMASKLPQAHLMKQYECGMQRQAR